MHNNVGSTLTGWFWLGTDGTGGALVLLQTCIVGRTMDGWVGGNGRLIAFISGFLLLPESVSKSNTARVVVW